MLQHRDKKTNSNISYLAFKVFTPQTDMTLVQEIVFRHSAQIKVTQKLLSHLTFCQT